MSYSIIFLLLYIDVLYSLFVNEALLVILTLFVVLGLILIPIFVKKAERINSIKLFLICFLSFFLYQLLCHSYRMSRGFDFIFSRDCETYTSYSLALLDVPFFELPEAIYSRSSYTHIGCILLYFVPCTKLCLQLHIDQHLMFQISLSFISALLPVVAYLTFRLFDFSAKRSFVYCIVYAFFTPVFILSGWIVRDMAINLFFMIMIYLSLKEFSLKNAFLILLMIFLIGTIRLSSGYFCILYLFGYLFSIFRNKQLNFMQLVFFGFVSLAFVFAIFSHVNYTDISSLASRTNEHFSYLESSGSNRLSSVLNRLPWGISHLSKVLVDQIWPTPCWTNLVISQHLYPETNNIMQFPVIFSKTFSFFFVAFLLVRCWSKDSVEILKQNFPIAINLVLSILFLCLQSNTMVDRRKMGCYIVFYVFGALLLQKTPRKFMKSFLSNTSMAFFIYQVLGLLIVRQ